MSKTLKKAFQFILFLGTGAVILYLVYQSQSEAYAEQCVLEGRDASECNLLKKVLSDFGSANYGWLGFVYIIYIISNISRTIRWQMLLEPLGKKVRFSTGFFAIMLGYFTNLGFPRVGEFIRAGALSRYEGVAVEKVMGTVVVDRILDVLSLLIVIVITAFVELDKLTEFVKQYVSFDSGLDLGIKMGVLMLFFGLVSFLVWKYRQKLLRYNAFAWFYHKVEGFAHGLAAVRKVKSPFWFIFHCVVIWVAYYAMTYYGLKAFDPTAHLGPDAGLVTFVFGTFGFVIPSPGGMGTYHFLIIEALKIFGVNSVDGFSMANILYFSIQIGANVLLGIVALIALPMIHQKKYQPKKEVNIEDAK